MTKAPDLFASPQDALGASRRVTTTPDCQPRNGGYVAYAGMFLRDDGTRWHSWVDRNGEEA